MTDVNLHSRYLNLGLDSDSSVIEGALAPANTRNLEEDLPGPEFAVNLGLEMSYISNIATVNSLEPYVPETDSEPSMMDASPVLKERPEIGSDSYMSTDIPANNSEEDKPVISISDMLNSSFLLSQVDTSASPDHGNIALDENIEVIEPATLESTEKVQPTPTNSTGARRKDSNVTCRRRAQSLPSPPLPRLQGQHLPQQDDPKRKRDRANLSTIEDINMSLVTNCETASELPQSANNSASLLPRLRPLPSRSQQSKAGPAGKKTRYRD